MSKRKCFHLNCTVLLYATVPATYEIPFDSFYYYRNIFKALTDSEKSN